jgi:hypothetical protein
VSKGEGGRHADLLASLGEGEFGADGTCPHPAQHRAQESIRVCVIEVQRLVNVMSRVEKGSAGELVDGLELRGLDYDYIGWSEVI